MICPEPQRAAVPEAAPQPLLEHILTTSLVGRGIAPLSGPVVGECLDERHSATAGRVLVRWIFGAEAQERWLPTLSGLTIRTGDQVLLLQPANWSEPLVVGIVAGAARPESTVLPTVTLQPNQALQIVGPTGHRLVEVAHSEAGPVVRLLTEGVQLETPGLLSIKADSIHLEARAGEVKVKASEDVIVQGEVIHLN
jgi:hypothetical protein